MNPLTLADELTLSSYQRDGYLIVRQVFAQDEMEALRSEAELLLSRSELIDTQNIRCRWQDNVGTGECMFDCFDPVIDIGPVCRYFAHHESLFGLLRDIYGEEAKLFKDKLIFKRPGAKGYGLHQDFIAWDRFPESFLTVVIPLDETNGFNGATEVFPGLHRQGCLSPRDGNYHELPAETIDESCGVLLELTPGDIAIFSGFTPHRSAPNHSQSLRRQLYLSFNAASDGGDQREEHYSTFHPWLIGKYAEYGKTGVYFR
jgi:2-aminoethylphosphonate dioxygenase